MSKEEEFLEWWDDGDVSGTNPYSKGTPIWWAWEGYLVGINSNRTTEESSATVKDSLSVVKECLTTRVERATRDNPDLPASFVRSVIEAMDEPLEDATPFAIRESRTVDYKLKPLTDEEIKECMNKAWREVVEHCVETKTDVDICDLDLWFARAIEAAHGIKGEE